MSKGKHRWVFFFFTIFWPLTLKYMNAMPEAWAASSRLWGELTYSLRVADERDGRKLNPLWYFELPNDWTLEPPTRDHMLHEVITFAYYLSYFGLDFLLLVANCMYGYSSELVMWKDFGVRQSTSHRSVWIRFLSIKNKMHNMCLMYSICTKKVC